MRHRRGFTLIELAIIMVILGILVGMGAGLVGLLIKRAKYSESRERVKENVEAIVGYALTHGHLPGTSSEIQKAMKSFRDSYNKKLMYVFSDNLIDSGSICNATTNATNIEIKWNCTDASCSSHEGRIQDVAFLIISADGNYNHQTVDSSLSGSKFQKIMDSPLIGIKVTDNFTINVYAPGVENIDDWQQDMNRPEVYDDIVEYKTLNQLKALLGCSSGGGGGGGGGGGNGTSGCSYILQIQMARGPGGNTMGYRINGGVCLKIKDWSFLSGLCPDHTVEIADNNCRNPVRLNGSIAPQTLENLDTNNDGNVVIYCYGWSYCIAS